jgi:Zn-dependent oligopeptidase
MSENLPQELIEKLNQSRKLLQGYHYARQLMFGIFDMKVHSKEFKENANELFSHMQKEILELETLEGTNEVASFGHLMHGYDAGYYGYAWSLVYAKDLFSKFKNDLLNPELGMKLRKQVLSQGSMRKSMDSIKEFLGREPNNDEFINSLI